MSSIASALSYGGCAVGSVEVARNTRYPCEARHDVLGSAGTILLGVPPQSNLFVATAEQRRGALAPELSMAVNDGYRGELAAFVACVAVGRMPEVDGHASRAALAVALAARESLRVGRPVEVK